MSLKEKNTTLTSVSSDKYNCMWPQRDKMRKELWAMQHENEQLRWRSFQHRSRIHAGRWCKPADVLRRWRGWCSWGCSQSCVAGLNQQIRQPFWDDAFQTWYHNIYLSFVMNIIIIGRTFSFTSAASSISTSVHIAFCSDEGRLIFDDWPLPWRCC